MEEVKFEALPQRVITSANGARQLTLSVRGDEFHIGRPKEGFGVELNREGVQLLNDWLRNLEAPLLREGVQREAQKALYDGNLDKALDLLQTWKRHETEPVPLVGSEVTSYDGEEFRQSKPFVGLDGRASLFFRLYVSRMQVRFGDSASKGIAFHISASGQLWAWTHNALRWFDMQKARLLKEYESDL